MRWLSPTSSPASSRPTSSSSFGSSVSTSPGPRKLVRKSLLDGSSKQPKGRARSENGGTTQKEDWVCFSDFDGTITTPQSDSLLFTRLGVPKELRKDLNGRVMRGELTQREAVETMVRKMAGERGYEAALQVARETYEIDPSFPSFVRYLHSHSIRLIILSSGLLPALRLALLDSLGPSLAASIEVRANDCWVEDRRKKAGWGVRFRDQEGGEGFDKGREVREWKERNPMGRVVYCGDGVSDICAATAPDLLFIRSASLSSHPDLARHCDANSIPYRSFMSFTQVKKYFEWVVEVERPRMEALAKLEGRTEVSFSPARLGTEDGASSSEEEEMDSPSPSPPAGKKGRMLSFKEVLESGMEMDESPSPSPFKTKRPPTTSTALLPAFVPAPKTTSAISTTRPTPSGPKAMLRRSTSSIGSPSSRSPSQAQPSSRSNLASSSSSSLGLSSTSSFPSSSGSQTLRPSPSSPSLASRSYALAYSVAAASLAVLPRRPDPNAAGLAEGEWQTPTSSMGSTESYWSNGTTGTGYTSPPESPVAVGGFVTSQEGSKGAWEAPRIMVTPPSVKAASSEVSRASSSTARPESINIPELDLEMELDFESSDDEDQEESDDDDELGLPEQQQHRRDRQELTRRSRRRAINLSAVAEQEEGSEDASDEFRPLEHQHSKKQSVSVSFRLPLPSLPNLPLSSSTTSSSTVSSSEQQQQQEKQDPTLLRKSRSFTDVARLSAIGQGVRKVARKASCIGQEPEKVATGTMNDNDREKESKKEDWEVVDVLPPPSPPTPVISLPSPLRHRRSRHQALHRLSRQSLLFLRHSSSSYASAGEVEQQTEKGKREDKEEEWELVDPTARDGVSGTAQVRWWIEPLVFS